MNLFKLLKDGQHYASIWPRHAVVAAMTETRVVPAVQFTARWMPALAVINLAVQWQWQGQLLVPQALVTSLFLLSLPFQGWYWLGRRANTKLDPRLRHWYGDLAKKLKVQPHAQPTYMHLAKILRKALQELPPDEH
jgi:Uncharacterized protein conserved in bacteria